MKIRMHYLIITLGFSLFLIAITGSYLHSQQATGTFGNEKILLYPKSMLPIVISEANILAMVASNHLNNNYQDNPITIDDKNKPNYISLDIIQEIHNQPIHVSYVEEDKQYEIQVGERLFQYILGTDVGYEGHRVFPMRAGIIYADTNSDSILISEDFLEYGLGYQTTAVSIKMNSRHNHLYVSYSDNDFFGATQVPEEGIFPVRDWDYEKRIATLQTLINPINGSYVSTRSTQWPGAPRSYRNGYHEGLDFYTHTSGVVIDNNTPVLSMDDGIIIRSDQNYIELTEEYRKEILTISMNRLSTPEYILDMLRGKSVWIQHQNGIVARYVHLNTIESDIVVGKPVKQGQIIGTTGNTGTSQGLIGSNEGIHLHLDILIYGQLFWEGLESEEIVSLLQAVFN